MWVHARIATMSSVEPMVAKEGWIKSMKSLAMFAFSHTTHCGVLGCMDCYISFHACLPADCSKHAEHIFGHTVGRTALLWFRPALRCKAVDRLHPLNLDPYMVLPPAPATCCLKSVSLPHLMSMHRAYFEHEKPDKTNCIIILKGACFSKTKTKLEVYLQRENTGSPNNVTRLVKYPLCAASCGPIICCRL